ncbi:MAG: hypothetical protein ACYS1A_14800 [Planctomycetota bacterium]|jgi:hypothetical protein
MDKKHIFSAILVLVFSSCFVAILFAEVTPAPWGGANVTPFPAGSPPTNPPLGDGGAGADARPALGWSGGAVTPEPPPKPGTFKVGQVGDITINGHTEIREPNNCDPNLHDHEMGHDALNKYEYDKNAKKKVEAALEGYEDMEFEGEGATPAIRDANALAKARDERDRRINAGLAALAQQMDEINAKYDKLTGHGSNDDPNSAEGVAGTIAEVEKAQQAGTMAADANSDANSTGKCTIPVGFDDQNLIFSGPGLITYTGDPCDPLNGQGEINIGGIIPIGLQENRTILLSDTHINITDPCSGETLLDAFIFEIAYMESTRPGYAGMIQGYLDVPPAWAGGTNNIIGSPFLESIQAACDSNEPTTFWFFANEPLFDERGLCIIPPESTVSGEVVLGVAIAANQMTVEDFESYATPPELQSKWIINDPLTTAVDLVTDYVKSGEKAMSIMYNTSLPPFSAEVSCEFIPSQDWLITEMQALELWVNDDQVSNVLGQMYVILESFGGGYYKHEISSGVDTTAIGIGPGESENWLNINIDLQEFASHGVALSEITNLTIGFGPGGGVGMAIVDDITLHKNRRFADLAGDLNLDDVVDFWDFAALAGDWCETGIWPEP